MTITLTREEAQQVLDALNSCDETWVYDGEFEQIVDQYDHKLVAKALETLRTRLAQPEPSVEPEKKYYKQTVDGKMDTVPAKGGLISEHSVEPVAWHEPGSYSNVTVYKKWAEENGWLPLYKEKT